MLLQLSTLLGLFLHVSIVLGISLRVIMRRPPSGTALAWMFLVAFLPLVGAVFYLLIGERRVGLRRARRIAALRSDYALLAQHVIDQGLTQVAWDKHRPEARGMDRLGDLHGRHPHRGRQHGPVLPGVGGRSCGRSPGTSTVRRRAC